MIDRHVFDPAILREYDVRGTVGRNLGPADGYAVGRGFATRVLAAGGRRIAVGRDGRLTSPELERALVAGLTDSGADVVRIGVGPTPMLYFAEATLDVDAGVQVTGSHNPPADNGFKLVFRHRSFFGDDVQDLARLAASGAWRAGSGRVEDVDVMADYVARLRAGHRGGAYRIGWDCGNGAAGPVVERLTRDLPGEHHLLYTDVDGRFPHHHPDPTEEANLADLQRLVRDKRLDFGIAFDGDGDRIGAVDGEGRVLWGDQLLALIMAPVLAACPGATVVADVKSSQYLFDRIAALGGRAVMGSTGHSLMKEAMIAHDAPIAGELSGHIFFRHGWYGCDDAIYAAVQLIGALHDAGVSLTEAHATMPQLVNTPDVRIPVDPSRKWAVVDEVRGRLEARGAEPTTIDGVRVATADGWWLLRASNTQDMLTLRAEAADRAGLDRLLAEVDGELAASGVVRN
ncbi:phosphomannomutase/phosphoglucomutase [Sphingomonas sp. MA1305]|uniref:phosphoglucomutase/phosphomannomutase PgmG n=1 Tax=Sphingomonas sp. MA1305 TaxID=2479204 RepID=UPI0018DFD7EA|nr:phosphomannomutase/phosphoglucomutase [Sphingomonas sp. MA1305]MBI0473787.1 phosphomannomutase/phosphoglucomutase [Sphingomonas sp. MA1305]